MEQSKEKKFVCKFCSKRFPCGKSLGGHIRTHMNNDYSVDSDEDDDDDKLKTDENGGQSSYGLRENPKKNKRFVDQRVLMALKQHQQQQQQEKQQQLLYCRECGKGFVSSKALCGHMACHSEREKIVMDSQSDTEASSSPVRTRSKRVVKHHHRDGFSSIMNQSNSLSSGASGIEPEQEEMALSLMMLSRDSSFKKGHNLVVNSLAESSDNNSVILETKSSSGEQLKRFNVEDKKKLGEVEEKLLRSGEDKVDVRYDSDNSDSGYFRNGPKKLDSDVSVDGFLRNKAVMSSGSGYDKNLHRFRSGSGSISGRSSTKYDLRKSKRDIPCYGQKKIKYEFTESVYDSGDHSLETDSYADTNQTTNKFHSNKYTAAKKASGGKKKSKGHECPICFRVFKSGQALGGHKRSHFIGNQEHRTLVIQQHHHHHRQVASHHEMHTLIDLNLPAPIDE